MKSAGDLREIIKGGVELIRCHKWLWLRSVVSGYIVGILPALGATVGSWQPTVRQKRRPNTLNCSAPVPRKGSSAQNQPAMPAMREIC